MNRRLLIAAALALTGCATWFGVLDRDRLIGDHTLIALPASDVSVGVRSPQ